MAHFHGPHEKSPSKGPGACQVDREVIAANIEPPELFAEAGL